MATCSAELIPNKQQVVAAVAVAGASQMAAGVAEMMAELTGMMEVAGVAAVAVAAGDVAERHRGRRVSSICTAKYFSHREGFRSSVSCTRVTGYTDLQGELTFVIYISICDSDTCLKYMKILC